MVLAQEPVYPLTVVEARAIGVMRMRDEKGIDDKVVAVSVYDPAYADYSDKDQLPSHVLRQVRRFFEDYKVLKGTSRSWSQTCWAQPRPSSSFRTLSSCTASFVGASVSDL